MAATSNKSFTVGNWLVEPERDLISRESESVYLRPQVMELLVYLARHNGRVVSTEDLLSALWPGKIVTESTVYNCLAELRQALADGKDQPAYIETIPKKGYRLLAPVAGLDDEPAAVDEGRKAVWFPAIVLAVVLVCVVAIWQIVQNTAPVPHLDQGAGTSVAVLPFTDMSPNQDQEYFADGIAEELLNELTQLEGLRVAGRISSFAFKGSNEDLPSIGEKLNVTNILEGSVRKDGNGLRITVQLINSLTGFHLWSKTYDRKVDDIFFIQDDIARSVAGALSVALDVDGRKALPGTGTSNIEAYDAFLEGLARNRVGQAEQAAAHFQRASDLDPNYAEAWVFLGQNTGITSWDQPPEQARATQARGRELVVRAIELDPNLAIAYSMLGQFNWARGDWVGAAEANQNAIALAPADIGPQMGYANVLGRVGRVRAAVEIEELGREIDPLNYFGAMTLAEHYIQVGRYSDARAVLEKAETLRPTTDPSVIMRRLFIAMSESERTAVREFLEELADANPSVATIARSVLAEFDSPPAVVLNALRRNYEDEIEMSAEGRVVTASLAAYFGDPELALEAMTEELRGNLLRTKRLWYPFFSDMRKLPGFKALADEIGFVAYWRTYGWADFCRPLSDDDFECS